MQVVLMVCKCLTTLRLRSESAREVFCRDSYYFRLVIDWIMKTTTTGRKKWDTVDTREATQPVTLTARMTWYSKAVARGGVPQVHVHPPFQKTKKTISFVELFVFTPTIRNVNMFI